uniref:Putative constitutive coactivator of peroxisome proliferator-activated receptor gamma n=1 Tax=Corethrella appendiculata TaxID=1370023 RepID=U5EPY3_9DIPT
MGVRHLETFIKSLQNGYVEISMIDEINSYKEKFNKKPVIVIDIFSFSGLFYRNTKDLLCGIRQQISIREVEQVFSGLAECGAELVFFFDGPLQEAKTETWINRQLDSYEKFLRLVDSVGCEDLEKLSQINPYEIPTFSTGRSVKKIAEKYGCVYKSVDEECDLEIAAYATKNQALAVLTQDSDFLIYEGAWRYWSSKFINPNTLTTMEYSREVFRQTLGLNPIQLSIFASLAGNDIIQFDDVKQFHRHLLNRRHFSQKFFVLSSYIERNAQDLDNQKIRQIIKDVFGYCNNELWEKFHKSLSTYNIHYHVKEKNTDPIFNILMECTSQNLKIYLGKTLLFSIFYIDLRDYDHNFEFFTKLKPLISRTAGILLQHKNKSNLFINCLFVHGECQEFRIPVKYPPVKVPALTELLSKDLEVDANLKSIKYELFCWILSDLVTPEIIHKIQPSYVASAITAKFLVQHRLIIRFEADLFLLTIHHAQTERIATDLPYPERLDERAVKVAFLLRAIYNKISECISTVGLREFKHEYYFDGVYFHSLWNKYNTKNVKYTTTLMNSVLPLLDEIQELRIY